MLCAIANGAFRESILNPWLGPTVGHIVSTFMLCTFIALITWFSISWIKPESGPQAAAIGGLWLALVLAFEFGFGYFIGHKTWDELLAAYNLAEGQIWVLVLITTVLAPYFTAGFKGVLSQSNYGLQLVGSVIWLMGLILFIATLMAQGGTVGGFKLAVLLVGGFVYGASKILEV